MDPRPKILIVEDEKPLARALELKLTHVGFDVVVAYNGKEALEIMKTTGFNLIILDLIMPHINGFDFLEILTQLANKPKIVVTSNLSQKEDVEKVKSMGASEYFIKSDTSLGTIVDHVTKLLTPSSV